MKSWLLPISTDNMTRITNKLKFKNSNLWIPACNDSFPPNRFLRGGKGPENMMVMVIGDGSDDDDDGDDGSDDDGWCIWWLWWWWWSWLAVEMIRWDGDDGHYVLS